MLKRIIGIDFGDKRIGIAISDPLRITAQALDTIVLNRTTDSITAVKNLVLQRDAEKIVVGLPISMNGQEGIRAQKTREWIAKLKESLPETEVCTWDERLTSKLADQVMLEANLSRKKRKDNSDKIAAVLILQNYLDSQRNQSSQTF